MSGSNVEQLLSMRKLETFAVEGKAPNFLAANNLAQDALLNACGYDPPEAWTLKLIQHNYDPETGGVQYHAEFVRQPDDDEDE